MVPFRTRIVGSVLTAPSARRDLIRLEKIGVRYAKPSFLQSLFKREEAKRGNVLGC